MNLQSASIADLPPPAPLMTLAPLSVIFSVDPGVDDISCTFSYKAKDLPTSIKVILNKIGACLITPNSYTINPQHYSELVDTLVDIGKISRTLSIHIQPLARFGLDTVLPPTAAPTWEEVAPDIPRPLANTLYGFQREGVCQLLASGQSFGRETRMVRAILADEQGLGKTLTALSAASVCVRHDPAAFLVVVCPASLRLMWMKSILQSWCGMDYDTYLLTKHPGKRRPRDMTPEEWARLKELEKAQPQAQAGAARPAPEAEDNGSEDLPWNDGESQAGGEEEVDGGAVDEDVEDVVAEADISPDCIYSPQTRAQLQTIPETACVIILTYALLNDLLETLPTTPTFLIFDESHYLKNLSSQRTRSALRLANMCSGSVLLLSGTPELGRPVDLYAQLRMVRPDLFSDYRAFATSFCGADPRSPLWTKKPEDVPAMKAENMEQLHWLIRRGGMILRRTKDELTTGLPEKNYHFKTFKGCGEYFNTAVHQLQRVLEAKARVSAARTPDEHQNAQLALRGAQAAAYQAAGKAKMREVVQHIIDTYAERRMPFIVFGHHQEVLDYVQDALAKTELKVNTIRGNTPQKQREDVVQAFQRGDLDALVLSIKAAATGITLTRAQSVFFAELTWVPADILQAIDRAHRLGSTYQSIDLYFEILAGTIDVQLASTLHHKLSDCTNKLFGTDTSAQIAQGMEQSPG